MNTPTKRQAEVLHWVQHAMSNKQIAKSMGIAESTVKLHITALLLKHGVKNRVQLALQVPTRTQREWVGLTDEEVQAAVHDENGCVVDYEDYAAAIEAKLKEKNTS